MELVILGGIAVVITLFIVVTQAFFPQRPWDHESQDMARALWLAIVVVAVAISAVWFGLAALLSIWWFWLLLAGASLVAYTFGEWRARANERKAAPTGELYRKVAAAEQSGGREPWMQGVNVPPQYVAREPRGAWDRLDRWLG